MKIFVLILFLGCFAAFLSCTSQKEGDLEVDCSLSDLKLIFESKENPTCTSPGSITVAVSGGEGGYTFAINGSGTQGTGTFELLSAGEYVITVEDASGCTAEITETLEIPESGITATVDNTTEAGCGSSEGSMTVTASGGSGNYTFALDGGSEVSSGEFTGLSRGSHAVEVTDDEGCSTTISAKILSGVSLDGDVMPIINAACGVNSSCHDGSSKNRALLVNNKAGVISNASGIKSRTRSGSMPKEGSLTQDEIDLISCWVDDGASDN